MMLAFTDTQPRMKTKHPRQYHPASPTQLTTFPSRFSSVSLRVVPSHVHPTVHPSSKCIPNGLLSPLLVVIGVRLPSIIALFGVRSPLTYRRTGSRIWLSVLNQHPWMPSSESDKRPLRESVCASMRSS